MAEDLGHIKIDFGDMGAGPSATKAEEKGGGDMATLGATIGMAFGPQGAAIGAIVGTVADEIAKIVPKIVEVFKKLVNIVQEAVRAASERGKFSPSVMMENVALKIQDITQQVREARVLGPMYTMVLRWYRELMRLLEPWKLLIQGLLSVLAGALLRTAVQILERVNTVIPPILNALISVIEVLRGIFQLIQEYQSGIGKVLLQLSTGLVPGSVLNLLGLAGVSSVSNTVGAAVGGVASTLDDSLKMLTDILVQISQVAQNTAPQANGSDWAATQLREIASISGLYRGTAQPGYATPGGQAPFFRPPGSTYP